MKDTNSLSHSKWNCKYYIVFAPKYRECFIDVTKNFGRKNKVNYVKFNKSVRAIFVEIY